MECRDRILNFRCMHAVLPLRLRKISMHNIQDSVYLGLQTSVRVHDMLTAIL
jgi:hypothetical protein